MWKDTSGTRDPIKSARKAELMNETCSRGIQLGALRSAAVRVHLCAHLYTRSIFLVIFAGGGVLLRTTVCLTDGEIYDVP